MSRGSLLMGLLAGYFVDTQRERTMAKARFGQNCSRGSVLHD
jgi:hypothetical protein